MLRTTSINQYYSLNGTGMGNPITVRPPKNLKVFRAHFICDNREDPTTSADLIICTTNPGTFGTGLEGVRLSSANYAEISTNVPPAVDAFNGTLNLNYYILDRRGIGYMADDFYIYGKGGIAVIWEGIIEE